MSYAIFQYLWLIAVLPKIVQLPILGGTIYLIASLTAIFGIIRRKEN